MLRRRLPAQVTPPDTETGAERDLAALLRPGADATLPERTRRSHRAAMMDAFRSRNPEEVTVAAEPQVHVREVQRNGLTVRVADVEPLDDGRVDAALQQVDVIVRLLRPLRSPSR